MPKDFASITTMISMVPGTPQRELRRGQPLTLKLPFLHTSYRFPNPERFWFTVYISETGQRCRRYRTTC